MLRQLGEEGSVSGADDATTTSAHFRFREASPIKLRRSLPPHREREKELIVRGGWEAPHETP